MMGTAERREREREQRFQSIVDAAEEVFFGKGYENATVDEVAEKAELSKGTIYLYFSSKEDLYHAVVLRALCILLKLFEESREKDASGLEKIAAIGNAYYRFHQEYPDYFKAMLHFEGPALEPECGAENRQIRKCEEAGNRIFELLCEIVEQGIRDGSMRPDLDPLKTSLTLWGHSTGIMQIVGAKGLVIETMSPFTSEQLIAYSFDMIRHSLMNPRHHGKGGSDEA